MPEIIRYIVETLLIIGFRANSEGRGTLFSHTIPFRMAVAEYKKRLMIRLNVNQCDGSSGGTGEKVPSGEFAKRIVQEVAGMVGVFLHRAQAEFSLRCILQHIESGGALRLPRPYRFNDSRYS